MGRQRRKLLFVKCEQQNLGCEASSDEESVAVLGGRVARTARRGRRRRMLIQLLRADSAVIASRPARIIIIMRDSPRTWNPDTRKIDPTFFRLCISQNKLKRASRWEIVHFQTSSNFVEVSGSGESRPCHARGP